MPPQMAWPRCAAERPGEAIHGHAVLATEHCLRWKSHAVWPPAQDLAVSQLSPAGHDRPFPGGPASNAAAAVWRAAQRVRGG
jgi:hypothetical protein